jgi:hypothetical protein
VILAASLIVAGAVALAGLRIAAELRAGRDERARILSIVQLFAPALAAVQQDPRAYLHWQPIARTTRQLFPTEYEALDRAAGGTFPFTAADLQAAHARWTAEWLAWERTHDADYKLRAAAAGAELATSASPDVVRGKLEAIENEKLDVYQRRYAEYVRVAKALQALVP